MCITVEPIYYGCLGTNHINVCKCPCNQGVLYNIPGQFILEFIIWDHN